MKTTVFSGDSFVTRALQFPCHLFLVATVCLGFASGVYGQGRIEFPAFPEFPQLQRDLGLIGGMGDFGFGSNVSISTSIENGVKKIRVNDNGKKFYIEEGPDGILVKATRQYGPEQMDILQEEHPELYLSIKGFPEQTENADEVEVSINVTKKYEADSLEELKEKHPEIFKAYEKYSSRNATGMSIRIGGGAAPGLRALRELRARNLRARDRAVQPAPEGIRIHEEANKGDKGKNESKPKSKDKDT